ncbi:MAG: ABC-three component system protein [Dehalococcoidia bacterium]
MIRRIYSSLSSFKTIELHAGLNLLTAERLPESSDRQTRNAAGKSSLVEVIHFLFGADARTDHFLRNPVLAPYTFSADFDLPDGSLVASRSGTDFGTVIVSRDSFIDAQRHTEERYSIPRWRTLLGTQFYGVNPDDQVPHAPTFRQLFSYAARRVQSGAFATPVKQNSQQSTGDQQVALAFLLGLDWTIPAELDSIRDKEKELAALRRATSRGVIGDALGSAAELRSQLALAEERVRLAHGRAAAFEVLPEYREREEEASFVTREIAFLSDENTIDRQLLSDLAGDLGSEGEQAPGVDRLTELYGEVGISLPGSVRRRFEEAAEFHSAILQNRRSYLAAEEQAALRRIAAREMRMAELDRRRRELWSILRSRGALDQFLMLQQEISRLEAQAESLRQRLASVQQLDNNRVELGVDRARLQLRQQQDIEERRGVVNEAIVTFEEISSALSERSGNLTIDATANGLEVRVEAPGSQSRGINNMQIFTFDMMIAVLLARRNLGPGFLIHDSHLFDGVDDRQVATALELAAARAEEFDFQYIVTMNSDDVPIADFSRSFSIDDYRLPVVLTDETEEGGLFGFRFD